MQQSLTELPMVTVKYDDVITKKLVVSTDLVYWPTMRASGVTFNLCAACDVIRTTADAASFSVLALPAVTVPNTHT